MFKKLMAGFMAAYAFVLGGTAMAQGTTVPVKSDEIAQYPEWTATSTRYGGTLIFSDSPETFQEDGILYEDFARGDVRLFVYHANGTPKKKKVAVVLENHNPRQVSVTVYKRGLSGPSVNYLLVGKMAQQRYFESSGAYILNIPAGGATILDSELDGMEIRKDELINGIYDFITDDPVKVRIAAMPDDADSIEDIGRLPVLPPDQQRLRGTFANPDILLVPDRAYDAKRYGPVSMTLADDKIDKYIRGIDATDGAEVVNYGNYGVVYHIFIPTVGEKPLTYLLNPRGGTYAGALHVKYQQQHLYTFQTPFDRLCLETPEQAAFLGKYDSDASLWFSFMPPGASNLPVKIVVGAQ